MNIKPFFTTLVILITLQLSLRAQNVPAYDSLFTRIQQMLEGKKPLNFKSTVFEIENLYFDNQLNPVWFDKQIQMLLMMVKGRIQTYTLADTTQNAKDLRVYGSIYKTLTDTTFANLDSVQLYHPPFAYNFDDAFGQKEWSNTFVSTLLRTHKGNCHSMPYLYKILCDEWGVSCHLALAPNHVYIKHKSDKIGWYNTELTSASFPVDAWLMASGYISLEAIQNGLYMDALDDKKCIALCLLDLAKISEKKNGDNAGVFTLKCCETVLKYFPNCINALLLKAETQRKQIDVLMKKQGEIPPSVFRSQKQGAALWQAMNQSFAQIHQLGYRAMPEKMYFDWLQSLKTEKDRFQNKTMQND